ncbi:MAG: GDSL-type esterase/lipase family protein [Melioribacteraceae bacterium]|nr:GDSL-type esterase/lipase family protein [Melioribacteraceae bacterium]
MKILLLLISIFFAITLSNAQRIVVAIGDANGAVELGWVEQLEPLRKQNLILNYSIQDNTIGFDNKGDEKLNTLKKISFYLDDAIKRSNTGNIDDIVILLGANDCKKVFADRNNEVSQNLEKLILLIKKQTSTVGLTPNIYIVSPPPLGADSMLPNEYKGGDERIKNILPKFMEIALKHNCNFIDIYSTLKPNFYKLTNDGIHLNSKGNKIVAESISRFLNANKKVEEWSEAFQVVDIKSPLDGEIQKAYFYISKSEEPQPLIVSLHTWSNNYTQHDPLAKQILEKDWNYIHPDFRGVNNTPKALGSKYVISDIDEAIGYAIKHGNVDLKNIHVIGKSGGGLATLLSYMTSKHSITSFSSWVPISDLQEWYFQSLGRKNKYAGHIFVATSNGDSILNIDEARNRSPFYMETPKENRADSRLVIYAGIHDGYTGSVPVSQSIKFYNKIIGDYGADSSQFVSDKEILDLVSMRTFPINPNKMIGSRKIIYERSFKNVSLVLFEGGHEMVEEAALKLLKIE